MPPRLEAIVLAAGAGRRFGGAKLTAPWRGGRLIDGALAAALAAPARRVILVTGADPAVADSVKAHDGARLGVVFAADYAEGMAASLRAGIAALAADTSAAFVFLGDMPFVPHDLADRLAGAMIEDRLAAVPIYAGRRGHPVLFDRALFGDLAALSGDAGARTLLDGLGGRLALVETDDPGVLADVDWPGDLKA